MKAREITTVLGVAAVTMAVVLAALGPGLLEAVDQEASAGVVPVISQPTIELDGIQVKLTVDKKNYAVGEEPIVLLEATNPTDRKVVTSVWVGMTVSSVQSMLSRMPALPEYVWSENCPIALEPGVTEQFQLNTGQKLVAGQMVSVTMSDKDLKAAMAKVLDVQVQLPGTQPR